MNISQSNHLDLYELATFDQLSSEGKGPILAFLFQYDGLLDCILRWSLAASLWTHSSPGYSGTQIARQSI